ncbi:hypothetical protein BC829DRAFT_408563 [Chytridium lagenaria]|nr:hypothetical protein BC829DRAFT_408563 [Chytridium lagenaria]
MTPHLPFPFHTPNQTPRRILDHLKPPLNHYPLPHHPTPNPSNHPRHSIPNLPTNIILNPSPKPPLWIRRLNTRIQHPLPIHHHRKTKRHPPNPFLNRLQWHVNLKLLALFILQHARLGGATVMILVEIVWS